ncbi:MAG: NTP transferase domain-containing protein [Alphaproteobacteria bacterium]|nr:NTP transferase domain-containing protein [Alphaproteobacteria bacterium]
MPDSRRRRIRTAVIFATGIGDPGRALTESLPRPLIHVGGKAIVDHLVDRLAAHGVERVIVALHHHRAAMAAHLAGLASPPAIEQHLAAEALDPGSVLVDVLPRLGGEPFLIASADALWLDGLLPTLDRLAAAWDPAQMDCLLLLQATVTARGYDGPGDYFVDPAGRGRRRVGHEIAGHLYAGVAVVAPRALRNPPAGAFGLIPIFDRAESDARLWALAHDGLWFRIGDAQGVVEAEIELGYRPKPAAEAEKLRT